jgi:type 1 glutamine amidotransferase
MAGLGVLSKCLEKVDGLRVETVKADEPWPEGPAAIDRADGLVIYLSEGAKWTQADPRRYDALTRLAARGGGLVALHWGAGCKANEPIAKFLTLLGGCHGGDDRKYQVLETDVSLATPRHPIATGLEDFRVHEELYYRLKFVRAEPPPTPVLTARIDGRDETVSWAWERPDGGRSFGFVGLHFHDNWKREDYRRLVTQAVLWTLKLPIPERGAAVEVPAEVLELPKNPPAKR